MIIVKHEGTEYRATNYSVDRGAPDGREEFASVYVDRRFIGSFKVERKARCGLTLMITGKSEGGDVDDVVIELLEEQLGKSIPGKAAA